jgi:hypothetical protein
MVTAQSTEDALTNLKVRAALETLEPMHLMFVSFAGDGQFVGGILVSARGPVDALSQIFERELYPGGEAAFMDAPDGETAPVEEMYKLMTTADIKRVFGHVYDSRGNEMEV